MGWNHSHWELLGKSRSGLIWLLYFQNWPKLLDHLMKQASKHNFHKQRNALVEIWMIFGFQFKKASRSQGEKNQLLIAPHASIQPPGTILSILSHHISLHGSVVTSLDQQLLLLPGGQHWSGVAVDAFKVPMCQLPWFPQDVMFNSLITWFHALSHNHVQSRQQTQALSTHNHTPHKTLTLHRPMPAQSQEGTCP